MSDDVLNIFDEKEPVQPEVGEKPEAEAPEPETAQPQDEPESKGDDEAAPPAAEEKDDQRHVPYEALKDERTKRQAMERELAEMRQWRAQIEAQQRDARMQSITDPDERLQVFQQEAAQAMTQQKLQMSRAMAERQYGAEFVQEVTDFFNDPQHMPASHHFMRAPDPFAAAVEYYNAAKALREIGTDPTAYRARLRDELRAELLAELNPTKPKTPPRSLSSAPASGGDRQQPPGSGFDELFPT